MKWNTAVLAFVLSPHGVRAATVSTRGRDNVAGTIRYVQSAASVMGPSASPRGPTRADPCKYISLRDVHRDNDLLHLMTPVRCDRRAG